ncbi:LysR substrate-binding domain-containing protein [Pseudomonas oryzihabitans]|uniref:LysR substrate-binding domain-containing protein n=1 Tax=Pseudomonas oryzihabitans TaxID=47885 RepID=UPI0028956C35|nr:LysR substrate-binding domain-containing protein [Pseudomonas oryzihabitans]MDT3723105.1 LysR substrate-binding domain-containing protein [Pseudomonas oryzihabitans]
MSALIEDIGALRAFVHAADLRSFKAAGEQLGVSSSAIGKAIQRLESQLCVRLFHRSTRAINLTKEGDLFLARCRKILGELELAQAELAQETAKPQGRLRVSFPVANALFTPLVMEFMAAYPAVNLDVDVNDRIVDVINEGFDVVIRSGAPQDSRLHHRKLGKLTYRLVASSEYLARHGRPAGVADLINHCCLRHRYPQTGKLEPWPVSIGEDDNGIVVPETFVTTTIDPLLDIVLAGFGVAALPDSIVRSHLDSGALEEILVGRLGQTGVLHLLWPSHRYPYPNVRAFVDFFSARMATLLAEP